MTHAWTTDPIDGSQLLPLPECVFSIERTPPHDIRRGKFRVRLRINIGGDIAPSLEDEWPRYYFDIEIAKREVIAWVNANRIAWYSDTQQPQFTSEMYMLLCGDALVFPSQGLIAAPVMGFGKTGFEFVRNAGEPLAKRSNVPLQMVRFVRGEVLAHFTPTATATTEGPNHG